MIDLLVYLGCGLAAGILGGYLGLGGGVLMVPYMVVLLGLDIRTAVPVSMAAITVNSVSASTEYLKKNMVDLELVLTLAIFLTIGNIIGSSLVSVVPADIIQLVFTAFLLYTSIMFLKGRKTADRDPAGGGMSTRDWTITIGLALLAGALGGLIGVGGGIILVPAMYLLVGLPLTTARGTMTFMFGFSAAASTLVFITLDQLDFAIVGPVILGILFGGKIGGLLGTVSKPLTVRIVFFVVLMYMAVRLGWAPIERLMP